MTETIPPLRRPLARWLPEAAILLLALAFRVLWLGIRPAHFDEGVNGWFVDQMREQGYYRYDPTNFHGPLHFYLLFIAEMLLGRHVWALRLPVALVSTGAVGLTLGFRRFFHSTTCRLAALAMAVSPAMTFYGRYAIHESEMLFFLLLTAWGLLGWRQRGDFRAVAAAVAGATGCVLTKETYAIHFVAFGLAFPALAVLEWLTGTPPQLPHVPPRGNPREVWLLALAGAGSIVFFYSGNFLAWDALPGLYQTFHAWVATGTDVEGGHAKPWFYWFQLLARYEWPALLGMIGALWIIPTRGDRGLRYLALAGAAAFVAFTVIRYKTPWCLISLIWPFFFHFGEAIRRAAQPARTAGFPSSAPQARGVWNRLAAPFHWLGRRGFDRWLAGAVAVTALGHSTYSAALLNFRDYTSEDELYVYVQTLPAINQVLDPLHWLAAREPIDRITGYVLFPTGDSHPLPWLLADYPHIEFPGDEDAKPRMDADLLLIENSYVGDMEDRLKERYFRQEIVIRGNSGETAQLYLRASTFAPLFPGRTPEFEPYPPPAPAP